MVSTCLSKGCSFGDGEGGFHGLIFLQIARAINKTKQIKHAMPASSKMSSIKWRIMWSGVSVVGGGVSSVVVPLLYGCVSVCQI